MKKIYVVTLLPGLMLALIWLMSTKATIVHASTFAVNSTADAVDVNPGNGVCATSTNVCTLRAAIQETNALAGDDVITLPAGTYTLAITGENEEDAATGDLDIHGNVTINGSTANTTIIDGGAIDRVFDIRSPYDVTFTKLTIQNGKANDTQIFKFGGGAIRGGGNIVLDGVVLQGNHAVNGNVGGAILIFGNPNGTSLNIKNSTISGNTAEGGSGAIDHNLSRDNTSIIIENSTLSNNTSGGFGGAIGSPLGTLKLTNVQLVNNAATRSGGALVIGYSGSDGMQVDITGTVFQQNSTQEYGAGIVGFSNNTTLNITNTTFISNTATSWGGAMYMSGLTNTLSIATSTFSQNSSGASGGALSITGTATGNITNSTFSGNQAAYSGGAVYGDSPSTQLRFRNVTIAYNVADSDINGSGDGGGLMINNAASFIFTNSLIANNIDNGNQAPDCYAASGFASTSNNLIGKTDGCVFTPGANDLTGTIASPLDPLLESLTGSPAYHPLNINSPAIDAGSAATPSDNPTATSCPTTDQGGSTRPLDGNVDGNAICDMGAVEAPERVAIVVEPLVGATLVYSDTQGNPTTVHIPVNAVTETTTMIYTAIPTITPTAGLIFGEHAFDLNAYRNEMILSDFAFEIPITLTITYTDADVAGLDEANLTLRYLSNGQWIDAACGSYVRDLDNNNLTVPICHLSRFALLGEGYAIFLPLIKR